MNVSPTAKPKTPAIARNQSLQPQQANQARPQSRSLQTSLPLAPRQQTNPIPSQREAEPEQQPLAGPERVPLTEEQSEQLAKHKQFLNYATRAAVNLDPLNQRDLQTVNVATEAMDVTRSMLPFRGNVIGDIVQSHGRSTHSINVARSTANRIKPQFKTIAKNLALAVKVGAGNCGEFANLTARNVVRKLPIGDTASDVKLTSRKSDGNLVDHVVTKINPQRGSGNSEIIADAWAKGAAVRTKDAPLTMQGPAEAIQTFNPMQGEEPFNEVKTAIEKIPENIDKDMITDIENRVTGTRIDYNDPGIFNEIQTTSQKFDNDSRAAAIKVLKLQGPRNLGEAAVESVVGDPDLDGAASVNTMVKQLAEELGVTENDAQGIQGVADQVAQAVRDIAEKVIPPEDKWLTIPPLPNP